MRLFGGSGRWSRKIGAPKGCDCGGEWVYLGDAKPLIMNSTELKEPRGGYVAPAVRVVETKQEYSFLVSDILEPIDGGDDPDIDW